MVHATERTWLPLHLTSEHELRQRFAQIEVRNVKPIK